ncbi:MAG: DUF4931 domain-containing protein [Chitinivibrionales bacterium]|nr:DUF4931 domain-containing protein [Chitinivibrionales bacterium]
MTENRHLCFLSQVWKKKVDYQGANNGCPFCRREELTEIIDEEDTIILVRNRFPTLENAFQTVLIESNDCSAEIRSYDRSHLRRVITFGTNHWLTMEESGDYRSVLFFKNHGPLFGGSIDHAHMQIIGLKDIDYRQNLRDEFFEGIEIHRTGTCVLNISTKPQACPIELNIVTAPRNDTFMAETIQKTVSYLLDHSGCGSYNLFFYQWNGSIICKVMPRYVTSPFLVGYSIPQTTNRLSAIAEDIGRACFS